MSDTTEVLRPLPSGAVGVGESDLVDYCAHPKCRGEFRQANGRGRRREFCSDTCRRAADRDYKRARAMVEHFERLAERTRHDVRAFGRSAEDGAADQEPVEVQLERARMAIERARAVLRFAVDDIEPWVVELRALSDGVAPLVGRL